jgi:hypothetical protein
MKHQQSNRNQKWRLIVKVTTSSNTIEHIVKEMDLKEACMGASYFKEIVKIHTNTIETQYKGKIGDYELVEPGVETVYEKQVRLTRRNQKPNKSQHQQAA